MESKSTWRCYECKEDMEYIDDDTSPRCRKCDKPYDGGPIAHIRSYGPGEFLAHIQKAINKSKEE